jgi:hypothetical protein
MSSAQAAFHHRQHPGSTPAATGQRRGSDGAATGPNERQTLAFNASDPVYYCGGHSSRFRDIPPRASNRN